MKIQQIKKTRSPLYRMITFTQAEKDGGCVLRDQGSWRKINGIMFNTEKHGFWYFEFRRGFKG